MGIKKHKNHFFEYIQNISAKVTNYWIHIKVVSLTGYTISIILKFKVTKVMQRIKKRIQIHDEQSLCYSFYMITWDIYTFLIFYSYYLELSIKVNSKIINTLFLFKDCIYSCMILFFITLAFFYIYKNTIVDASFNKIIELKKVWFYH